MARVEDEEMSWSCDDDPQFSDGMRWIVSEENKNDQIPKHLDAFLLTFENPLYSRNSLIPNLHLSFRPHFFSIILRYILELSSKSEKK